MADPSRPNAILLDYLDAKRPSTWQSKSAWPRQSAPTPSQRRLWKRFLVSSYLRYLPLRVTPPGLSTPQSPPPPSVPPTSHQTFAAYLATLPRFQRRLIDGYQQTGTDGQLLRALRSRAHLPLASDGGLSGAQGTHGWVLSNGSDIILQCSGPVDGPADTASSTRSELAGCTSALLLLVSLTRFWGLKFRCKFNWYTDSRAAISRINRFSRCSCNRTQTPQDVDLLSLTADLLRELGRPFRARWVKGHQDRQISTTLSHAAALNILVDSLATAYCNTGRLSSMHRMDHQSSQKCSITLGGYLLTSQFDECIRYHINGYRL
jgi:ribonuclease HI